jgi:hypothetical protein
MLASLLIIAISAVLFFYWFRYTCMLILSTKTSKDYAGEVAAANQLQFLEIQGALREDSRQGSDGTPLDRLLGALEHDYTLVSYLLRQAAPLTGEGELGDAPLEQYMLRLDFWAMRTWYRLTRPLSTSAARGALQEMSMVVGHFANAFGERVAQDARA